MLATWRPLRTVSQPPCQCSAPNKPAFSHRNVNSSFRMRRGQQLFACDSNNKCFRDLAARHCAFADVECADLGRERWRTIIANLLVTNCALGLLLKRKLELGIHEEPSGGRCYLVILSDEPRHASSKTTPSIRKFVLVLSPPLLNRRADQTKTLANGTGSKAHSRRITQARRPWRVRAGGWLMSRSLDFVIDDLPRFRKGFGGGRERHRCSKS